MNLNEIPDQFKSVEQANEFWNRFKDEKIQKQIQIIDQINLQKQLRGIKDEDEKKFFENVFMTTLERYD